MRSGMIVGIMRVCKKQKYFQKHRNIYLEDYCTVLLVAYSPIGIKDSLRVRLAVPMPMGYNFSRLLQV